MLKGALKQKSNSPPTFLNSLPGFQSTNLIGQSNVNATNQVCAMKTGSGIQKSRRAVRFPFQSTFKVLVVKSMHANNMIMSSLSLLLRSCLPLSLAILRPRGGISSTL